MYANLQEFVEIKDDFIHSQTILYLFRCKAFPLTNFALDNLNFTT